MQDAPPVVAVGASAGGVEALQTLVSHFPADLPATVLVVLHVPAGVKSRLHDVLQRAGRLPAQSAEDGEKIQAGRIVVARPDHHLILDGDRVRVARGPKENRARPAIDVLFRSAAYSAGARAVGVLLSGTNDDGTAGLWAIKDRGGTTLVQTDALYPTMPEHAAQHVDIDFALPVGEIGRKLADLVNAIDPPLKRGGETRDSLERLRMETRIAEGADALEHGFINLGPLSRNTCPECHGALVEIQEGPIHRYCCHTGHAYSLRTLRVSTEDAIETTMGNAMRALEERIMLLRELANTAERSGDADLARRCRNQTEKLQGVVDRIREFLLNKHADLHFLTVEQHAQAGAHEDRGAPERSKA